jgi:LPS-assembly protein
MRFRLSWVGFACAAGILLVALPRAWAQDIARLFDLRGGLTRFEADHLRVEPKKKTIRARGHVRLIREGAVLEANEVHIDRVRGVAQAKGRVRIRSGTRVLVAEHLELDLASMVTVLRGAELFVKEGITPEALRELLGERALRRAGRNTMQLRARRIVKGPGPAFRVEGAALTPCDCGDDPPSWQITAPTMTVDPAEGAFVEKPIFRIGEDGVFGLPLVWVPFGERRTGLLQPQIAYTGINGWLAQGSFFWAATPSLDFTFAGEYLETRGFRPSLELRFAQGERSDGRLSGAWLRDTALGDTHRFNLDGFVRQELWPGARAVLDLALVSDSHYVNQFFYALRDRSVEYLTSTLGIEHARGDHSAFVAADWFQDLLGGTGPRLDLFSSQAGSTVHRLPRARYELLPRRLGESPLLLGVRAGVTHFYRTAEAYDDVGGDGVFSPGDPARVYRRLDFVLGVSAPVEAVGIQIVPRVSYRQLVYDAPNPTFPAARGHLLLGLDVAAPLWRLYGAGDRSPATPSMAASKEAPIGAWKHVVEPIAMVRFVPATYERGSGLSSVLPGLDDLDNLERAHRLYAGVRTRIVRKTGPSTYTTPFSARLTQGMDLSSGKLADLRLRAQLTEAPLDATLDFSYDPRGGTLDESLVSVALRDSRGDSFTVSHNYLRATRHERFDLEDVESPLYRAARARAQWFGGIHELTIAPSIRMPYIPLTLSWTLQYSFSLKEIVQSVYAMRYDSPCRCWGLSVQVAQVLGIGSPVVGFFLSLTALGSGGAGLPVF